MSLEERAAEIMEMGHTSGVRAIIALVNEVIDMMESTSGENNIVIGDTIIEVATEPVLQKNN